MNISEATAVNRALRYFLQIPEEPVDLTPGPALVAVVDLADRAHRALGAGLTGDEAWDAFRRRVSLDQALRQRAELTHGEPTGGEPTEQQKAAVVAALESGNYFACDGEEIAGLPECKPCEGTGKRFVWDDLPDCTDCDGLGKIRAADGAS